MCVPYDARTCVPPFQKFQPLTWHACACFVFEEGIEELSDDYDAQIEITIQKFNDNTPYTMKVIYVGHPNSSVGWRMSIASNKDVQAHLCLYESLLLWDHGVATNFYRFNILLVNKNQKKKD